MRIQGAFVSDEERESVIQFIKEGSSAAEHNEEIEQFMLKATEEKGGVSSDKGGKGGRKMSRKETEATIAKLTAEMREAARLLEFEHAAYLRDKIAKLKDTL